jgi:hypothetical protein
MTDASRARGHPRWRDADPIAPAGRIAGLTTAACLVLAGVATTAAAAAAMACSSRCQIPPAFGGLALFLSVPTGLAGAAAARSVARRPVDPEGGVGWRWGLGILFAAGVAITASRLPSLTCSPGDRLDSYFAICIDAAAHRYPASSWVWLKLIVVAAGLVVGLFVIRSIRAPRATAAATAVVWAAGVGWLLVDTLGRNLFR